MISQIEKEAYARKRNIRKSTQRQGRGRHSRAPRSMGNVKSRGTNRVNVRQPQGRARRSARVETHLRIERGLPSARAEQRALPERDRAFAFLEINQQQEK